MAVPKAAVIGAGPMGRWLARHLTSMGYQVKMFDKNPKLLKELAVGRKISPANSLDEAIRDSQIVALAVGARNAARLIKQILPRITGKTLVDVSSVKTPVVNALKQTDVKNNLILLVHPLFGPAARHLEDKTVLLAVYKNRRAEYRTCKELFSPSRIQVMSPREHDLKMAAAMALTRILLLTMFDIWRKKSVENLVFSQKALHLAASTILTESSSLISEIVADNPYTTRILRETMRKIQSVKMNPVRALEAIREEFPKPVLTESYTEIYRLLEKLEAKNK
ncbi:MAG: prephenate dehydrogenase/arogenate dehydrogenase family protein [Candidatus Caldarchaeum sp.]